MNQITIPEERYEQLKNAERDLQQIKYSQELLGHLDLTEQEIRFLHKDDRKRVEAFRKSQQKGAQS